MELINNISKTLRDDMKAELHSGSKLSIAASCFSIYAFQELKAALKDSKELTEKQTRKKFELHQQILKLKEQL